MSEKLGMFSVPQELTRFMASLADHTENQKIYFPFAGFASEMSYFPEAKCVGTEINPDAWDLSRARFSIAGRKDNISLDTSFEELQRVDKSFDGVMMFPPFILMDHHHKLNENDAVRLAITNKLKPGGWLITALPLSFTYTARAKSVREFLVNEGYLTAVITLPQSQPFRSVPLCVLIAKKIKQEKFILVDGLSLSSSDKSHNDHTFSDIDLLDIIEKGSRNYVISLQKVDLDKQTDLYPSRYLLQLQTPEGFDKYCMEDVVTTVGKRVYGNRIDRTKKVYSLKGFSNSKGSIATLEEEKKTCNILYCIDEPCVAVKFANGKPSVCFIDHPVDGYVYLFHNVFLVKPTSLVSSPYYLMKVLLSDEVKCQVAAWSVGSVFRILSLTDFLQLTVFLPSLKKQEETLMTDNEKELATALEQQKNDMKIYQREIHRRKHAVGQIVSRLNSAWNLLQAIKESNDGIIDTHKVIKFRTEVNVGELVDRIGDLIDRVGTSIDNFTIGENELYTVEEFALIPFLRSYMDSNKSSVFTYNSDQLEEDTALTDLIDQEDGKVRIQAGQHMHYVTFSKNALAKILDDIISNALEHGFKGREENMIKMSFDTDGDKYIVLVQNNGNPIPTAMPVENIMLFGETTASTDTNHSGIGGYEVALLMEKFDGKAEIISTPDSEFTVTYKLTFNKTNADDLASLENV